MNNSETIIIKLYNLYKFIEPEFLKFKKLPCFNDVKDLKDGLKKINDYIAQEIFEKGFIETFENVVSKSDIYNAFNVFYIMSKGNYYNINEDDVIALAENKEYQPYYDAFIKQYFIKSANDLDKRNINNELLKRVLAARLNPPERKDKESRNHSAEIKNKEEQKEVVEKRRVKENMPNENKYYIIAYKNIDADHSLIDKAIAKLSESERKLIERKGRIMLGVFDKLLTQVEEKELNSILNRIRSNLGLEKIPQEEHTKISIIKPQEKKKKKGEQHMARQLHELINTSEEECNRLIGYLSDKEKRIIEKRKNGEELTKEEKSKYYVIANKLRRWISDENLIEYNYKKSIFQMIKDDEEKIRAVIENDLSKNEQQLIQKREDILSGKSKEKLTNVEINKINAIVYKIKVKLGIKKLPPKKSRRKENPQQTGKKRTTIYSQTGKSKEETDAFIEKLSDDDKRIVNDRLEGKKQSKEDVNRYFTILYAFKENKVPSGNRRINSKKNEITNPQLKDESKFANYYRELLSHAVKNPRVIQEIDIMDLAMTCFRYGICEGVQKKTCEDIAKYFECEEETVEEVTSKVLEKLYNVIVESLESNNTKSGKVIVKTNEETK